MKILMLTPYLPYPLWSGGQIRTYNLLKHLSKKHDITLFSFIREEKEKKNIKHLKKFCSSVKVFKKRPPFTFTSLFQAGVTFYPLVVCMYLNSEVRKSIRELIDKEHFDLIHAETFYVMPNIPENKIPVILVEQTIEHLVYKHFTRSVRNPLMRFLMYWDVVKIHFWEKRFWRKAFKVVAMSEADKKVMQSQIPKLSVNLVPNGVDTDFFSPKKSNIKQNTNTVLFVGNFKWLQNREAVFLLVNQIWKKIKSDVKNCRLWIVGKFPTKDILALQAEDITVSENIDDIRQAYELSDVLLAPILGPGGTRYKILESMAMKRPVITTKVGIEGLGVKHNKHVLISQSIEDLACETVRVLENKKLYRRLATNSRRFVRKHYDWRSISTSLDKIYQKAKK